MDESPVSLPLKRRLGVPTLQSLPPEPHSKSVLVLRGKNMRAVIAESPRERSAMDDLQSTLSARLLRNLPGVTAELICVMFHTVQIHT